MKVGCRAFGVGVVGHSFDDEPQSAARRGQSIQHLHRVGERRVRRGHRHEPVTRHNSIYDPGCKLHPRFDPGIGNSPHLPQGEGWGEGETSKSGGTLNKSLPRHTTGRASVSGETLRGSHSPSDELPISFPSSTIILPLSIVFTGYPSHSNPSQML